jgi:hypothetical protein
MYTILSTYEEYAPEHDDYPNGRAWPGTYLDRTSAWLAVEAYLLTQGWSHMQSSDPDREDEMAIAPEGHDEPTFFWDDLIAVNDAETITIKLAA